MPRLSVAGLHVHYIHRLPVPRGQAQDCRPPSLCSPQAAIGSSTRSPRGQDCPLRRHRGAGAAAPWQLPVVFIHGAGGNHQHWLYQVRDLSHHPTYALDLPGHGQSEGPGRDTIAAYADWLATFLDAVGLDRAVLVGHSMGGAVAIDEALRSPGRVAGLGLVATGARLRVAQAILDSIRQDPTAAVQFICSCAFGPEASPEMLTLGQRQMGATPADVLYGDFAACDRFDAMGRLADIRVPTFVLCGTQDLLTPPKYSAYLRDHIPGAELHLVEGAGHMVMVEQPQGVAQALEAFLDSL